MIKDKFIKIGVIIGFLLVIISLCYTILAGSDYVITLYNIHYMGTESERGYNPFRYLVLFYLLGIIGILTLLMCLLYKLQNYHFEPYLRHHYYVMILLSIYLLLKYVMIFPPFFNINVRLSYFIHLTAALNDDIESIIVDVIYIFVPLSFVYYYLIRNFCMNSEVFTWKTYLYSLILLPCFILVDILFYYIIIRILVQLYPDVHLCSLISIILSTELVIWHSVFLLAFLFVMIKIYNMVCQAIRTLVDEKIDAGYHQIAWDG